MSSTSFPQPKVPTRERTWLGRNYEKYVGHAKIPRPDLQ